MNEALKQADESVVDPRTPGLSPDKLVHVGERLAEHVQFHVYRYGKSELEDKVTRSVEDCVAFAREGNAWIQVIGLHEVKLIAELVEALSIHPLVREDVLNTLHRPKIESYDDLVLVTTKLLYWKEGADEFATEQLSVVLKEGLVVSFHESEPEQFQPVIERLSQPEGRLRKLGADYLFWALLDTSIDHYFPVFDRFEERMESIEEQLERDRTNIDSSAVFECRRETLRVYQAIRPLRDVMTKLQRLESPMLTEKSAAFFRDLVDNAWHALDEIDALREASAGMRDFHTAVMNNHMNQVMKVLTCFATIFMPLTFLAGIYGMNFKHMPELSWPWAYAVVWVAFLVVSGAMFLFFRRKGWL